jgi:hypothetical protein
MQLVQQLLAVPGSAQAEALRLGLCGLCAMLRAAATPGDPGGPAAAALLGELERLLAGGEDRHVAHVPPQKGPGLDLSRLTQYVQGDPELGRLHGPEPFPEDVVHLWHAAQRLTLRVAPARRKALQQALVKAAGGTATEAGAERLPLPEAGLIYPGLCDGMQVVGWQASPDAPLDQRLGDVPAGPGRALAGLVSVCLRLIVDDHCLHHALYGLFMFGVKPFDDLDRDAYAGELVYRLQRWLQCTDVLERFRALLDLDEAINSLLYRPMVDRDSWWAGVQFRSRSLLDQSAAAARSAGHDVSIQVLGGAYRTARSSSTHDLQVEDSTTPPGEVIACLRVAARVGGQLLPGRVLYRALGG